MLCRFLHLKLAILTFLEELQQQQDVRQYDMQRVELETTPGRRLLVLQVCFGCGMTGAWQQQ